MGEVDADEEIRSAIDAHPEARLYFDVDGRVGYATGVTVEEDLEMGDTITVTVELP